MAEQETSLNTKTSSKSKSSLSFIDDEENLSSTSLLYELTQVTPDSSFVNLPFEIKKSRETGALKLSIFVPRTGEMIGVQHEKEKEEKSFLSQAIPVPSERVTIKPRYSMREPLDEYRMPLMSKLGMAEEKKEKWKGRPSVYVKEILDFIDQHSSTEPRPARKSTYRRRSSLLIAKERWERRNSSLVSGEEQKPQTEQTSTTSTDDLTPQRSVEEAREYSSFGKLDYLSGKRSSTPDEIRKQVLQTKEDWDQEIPSYDDYYRTSPVSRHSILPGPHLEVDPGLWERELSDPSHLRADFTSTADGGITKVLPDPRKSEIQESFSYRRPSSAKKSDTSLDRFSSTSSSERKSKKSKRKLTFTSESPVIIPINDDHYDEHYDE